MIGLFTKDWGGPPNFPQIKTEPVGARAARKEINRRRYERCFHRRVPHARAVKDRTPVQVARSITREAIETRRWAMGLRGFFQWIRGSDDVKQLAVPRGKYHSATRKGPGRRPMRPRTEVSVCSRGAKWLPRGFPRGY